MKDSKKFTDQELELIVEIYRVFHPEIIVYYATVEQIEQLKAVGVKGVSRQQRKD